MVHDNFPFNSFVPNLNDSGHSSSFSETSHRCCCQLLSFVAGDCSISDPSGRNQSHVGRVCFPLRAEMHGRAHITDSCFIAFITSKIC